MALVFRGFTSIRFYSKDNNKSMLFGQDNAKVANSNGFEQFLLFPSETLVALTLTVLNGCVDKKDMRKLYGSSCVFSIHLMQPKEETGQRGRDRATSKCNFKYCIRDQKKEHKRMGEKETVRAREKKRL